MTQLCRSHHHHLVIFRCDDSADHHRAEWYSGTTTQPATTSTATLDLSGATAQPADRNVQRNSALKEIRLKYSTRCVLGKWVYLVTHAMSLFDLRDVCMVIGSLATLDLPMVVDLIGIFVLKGPYCTLTMTNWFLQALSVIPRGSWGDVARRFTMIRWGPNCYFGFGGPKNCFRIIILSFINCVDRSDPIVDQDYDGATVMDLKRMCTLGLSTPPSLLPLLSAAASPCRRRPPPPRRRRRRTCSDRLDEEIPSVKYSSCFLVKKDEGIKISVVDRIRRRQPPTVEVSISS
ncbi:hypothetical protein F511_17947 [Dorcoceras hygrometricum]|uniref:Uncharacterized protein n=1 Tax=Dorcoceras hygrometricum TaxID=472368 RepID=A0A2Z7AHD2_9LAMI|nr:hypothetical protein F511_17947 [Dorcoceras hygrometricum]